MDNRNGQWVRLLTTLFLAVSFAFFWLTVPRTGLASSIQTGTPAPVYSPGQGYTGVIAQTGSPVTMYSASNLALGNGACFSVSVSWYGGTVGTLTENLVVDSTVVATLRPNTYSVAGTYFTQQYQYCNRIAAGGQTIFVPYSAYCSSGCTSPPVTWNYEYALDVGVIPTATAVDWSTGTHTISIQTTSDVATGNLLGYFFAVRQ